MEKVVRTFECLECGNIIAVVGKANGVICTCSNPMSGKEYVKIPGPVTLWENTIKYK